VKKWGWLAVFVMAIIPIVFDVVGIIAGALRMPVWRFFIACWLGRTVSYVVVIYLTSQGLKVLPWFG
jgi:membrane protein DedA with SNARE-associated domain